jgi:hypothetical protein
MLSRNPDAVMNDVGNIALYHLMLNNESMATCQQMGYNGFKRKHRYNSNMFLCLLNKIKNKTYELYETKIDTIAEVPKSQANTLSLHLSEWIVAIEKDVKKLGKLNKEFVEITGISCEIAKKMAKYLLQDYMKIKRWIAKLTKCEWNEIVINQIDMHIHGNYKKKEKK